MTIKMESIHELCEESSGSETWQMKTEHKEPNHVCFTGECV